MTSRAHFNPHTKASKGPEALASTGNQSSISQADQKAQDVFAAIANRPGELVTTQEGKLVSSNRFFSLSARPKSAVIQEACPAETKQLTSQDKEVLQYLLSTYKLGVSIDLLDLIHVHFFHLWHKISPHVSDEARGGFMPDFVGLLRLCTLTCLAPMEDAERRIFIEDQRVALQEELKILVSHADLYLSTLDPKQKKKLLAELTGPAHYLKQWKEATALLEKCLMHRGLVCNSLAPYAKYGSKSLNVTSPAEVEQCLQDLKLYAEMIVALSSTLSCPWLSAMAEEIGAFEENAKTLSLKEKKEQATRLVKSIDCNAHFVWELSFVAPEDETDPIALLNKESVWRVSKTVALSWVDNVLRILEWQILAHLDTSYVFQSDLTNRIVLTLARILDRTFSTAGPLKGPEKMTMGATGKLSHHPSENRYVYNPSQQAAHFMREFVTDSELRQKARLSYGFHLLNQELGEFLQVLQEEARSSPRSVVHLAEWFLLQHDIQVYLGLEPAGGIPFSDEFLDLLLHLEDIENARKEKLKLLLASEGPLPQEPAAGPESLSSTLPPILEEAVVAVQPDLRASSFDEIFDVINRVARELLEKNRKIRKTQELLTSLGYAPVQLGDGRFQGKGSHTFWKREEDESTITLPAHYEVSIGVRNSTAETVAAAIASKTAGADLQALGFELSQVQEEHEVWERRAEDGRIATLIIPHQKSSEAEISQVKSSSEGASAGSAPKKAQKKKKK